MTTGGSISLLIDSPLQTLAYAMRDLEPETKRQIGKATKSAALPIWSETTLEQAQSRLQVRLAESANVGVTAQNVFLRAGGVGTLGSGTPLDRVAKATEYGANPTTPVRSRSSRGTAYTRRLGNSFGPPRRGGKVAGPAANEGAIRRIASLWVQTAFRTTHEKIETVTGG